jgi:hypothetical protein
MLLPLGAPEQRRFRRALTALKSPLNPALADQGSWRAKGDRDEYGEPPAPAVLADATDAKEEKEEKADAMDRTENVDYTLGMEERGGHERNQQDEVDDCDDADKAKSVECPVGLGHNRDSVGRLGPASFRFAR